MAAPAKKSSLYTPTLMPTDQTDPSLEAAIAAMPDDGAAGNGVGMMLPELAQALSASSGDNAPGFEALHEGDIGDPLIDVQQQDAESQTDAVYQTPPDPALDDAMAAGQEDETASAEDQQREQRQALAALYGSSCPLSFDREPQEIDWAAWPEQLWESLAPTVAGPIHRAQRNRLFRKGIQWVSAEGYGPWREPPKPKNAARMVANMIRPALDQRLQILIEQRPGFRTEPTNHDPSAIRKAEAQQRALEYQFDQQAMEDVMSEAAYWAQTDGVSFPCVYWDADRGPWFEETPGQRFRGGDLATMVYRIEQVRVSPNASSTRKPYYWVVCEELSQAEAVALYGARVLDAPPDLRVAAGGGRSTGSDTGVAHRLGAADTDADMLADQAVVKRFTIYCEPTEFLPDGLVMVSVGNVVVADPKPLPWGRVTLFRWADGSTDPAFYAEPIMEDWIAEQQMTNAALSKWVEAVRRSADGQMIAKSGAVSTETLVGGMTSLIEVRGAGAVSDAIQKLQPTMVGPDTKELLTFAVQRFEMKSGWNDTSRGSFDAGDSGRAILAQREVLERIFSPPVKAAARAMVQWAELSLIGMRWGYTAPRMLGIVGQNRSDLAIMVSAETFDGIADVKIDAETMQPLPRSLRLFLLDDLYQKGGLSMQEYRRRMPFSYVQSLESPDEDQYARAKRTCEAIRQTGMGVTPPGSGVLEVRWQDDEAIHQDVLQRDLILPDDIDPMIRGAAMQRWVILASQAAFKMQMMAPALPAGPEAGGSPGQGAKKDPKTQPLGMNNPSVETEPANAGR